MAGLQGYSDSVPEQRSVECTVTVTIRTRRPRQSRRPRPPPRSGQPRQPLRPHRPPPHPVGRAVDQRELPARRNGQTSLRRCRFSLRAVEGGAARYRREPGPDAGDGGCGELCGAVAAVLRSQVPTLGAARLARRLIHPHQRVRLRQSITIGCGTAQHACLRDKAYAHLLFE